MKIEVFFTNGNRAKFDMDKVLILDEFGLSPLFPDMDMVMVNWNAVSFIRPVKQEHDDDD